MKLNANSLAIEVDDCGPPNGQPLLLIMGLGMSLLAWPTELVDDLVGRGFRVVRMDNRDIGLSQGFDHHGVPNLWRAGLRHALRMSVRSSYSLGDMADDAVGVLDALALPSAHVCGVSLGGMVAQHLAARHPLRVRSLTLVMTTSGARGLPQPRPAIRAALLRRPQRNDLASIVDHLERMLAVIGSPAYRPDPQRQRDRLEAMVNRSWRPQGTARQLLAVLADGDRSAMLRRIVAPTAIVHGQLDPLIPVAAAHDLAGKIAGASIDIVPGMGHDLPLALMPRLAADIAATAARWNGAAVAGDDGGRGGASAAPR